MKSRYSIGIFIAASVMIAGIMLLYQDSYQRTEKRYLSEQETKLKEETDQTEGTAKIGSEYYLAEENGYVIVYLADQKTVFERTSIPLSGLPEKLQKEIREKKKIRDMKTLYGFLENYSSQCGAAFSNINTKDKRQQWTIGVESCTMRNGRKYEREDDIHGRGKNCAH